MNDNVIYEQLNYEIIWWKYMNHNEMWIFRFTIGLSNEILIMRLYLNRDTSKDYKIYNFIVWQKFHALIIIKNCMTEIKIEWHCNLAWNSLTLHPLFKLRMHEISERLRESSISQRQSTSPMFHPTTRRLCPFN